MTDVTDRDVLVRIFDLIEQVDHLLNHIGNDRQAMSVGPVLTEVDSLRHRALESAVGYGVVPDGTSIYDLRNEAATSTGDQLFVVDRDFLITVDEAQVALRRSAEAVPDGHFDVDPETHLSLADDVRDALGDIGLGEDDD